MRDCSIVTTEIFSWKRYLRETVYLDFYISYIRSLFSIETSDTKLRNDTGIRRMQDGAIQFERKSQSNRNLQATCFPLQKSCYGVRDPATRVANFWPTGR